MLGNTFGEFRPSQHKLHCPAPVLRPDDAVRSMTLRSSLGRPGRGVCFGAGSQSQRI